jgi:hypothetical protein
MDMLRKPGTYGGKKEEPRHAELGHDVPRFALPLETQGHALTETFRGTKDGSRIPAPFAKPFPNDIGSTDPRIR